MAESTRRHPLPIWSIALTAASIAAGCIGHLGDPPDGTSSGGAELRVAVSGMRRLTAYEYDRTLVDLLHDEKGGAALNLPADDRTPFDNDYESQDVSQALVESVELLAGDVADRLLADPARRDEIVGCTPTSTHDQACFTAFVNAFGPRALRRPLDADEIAARIKLLDFADQAGDFYFAVGLAVRSFLEDPSFLYRIETGAPVGDGTFRLSDWEIASRLSYLVWGTMPDAELFEAASSGQLSTSEAVRAQAERMLADARAVPQIERFHAMWMGYEGMLSGGSLGEAMRAETDALFQKIVGDGLPWLELFRWPETFVDAELAQHYGLEPPAGGSGWIPYDDARRGGLLSHASFLAVGAEGARTSPTTRGRLIRELLLCQPIPPPPKNVTPSFGNEKDILCKKDKYAVHDQGGCATCHKLMDGIGFGLERYDATGAYQTNEPDDPATEQADESQCTLPSSGKLVLGSETYPFEGPGELGRLLSDSDELVACMGKQLYRFAVGRSRLDDVDDAIVAAMLASLKTRTFRFDDLIIELVSRDSFRLRREPAQEK